MRLYATLIALLALVLVPASIANADSWATPTVETITSENGQYRLIITPRSIAGPLEYFTDKVESREPAGQQVGGERTASARLERREADGSWSLVWDNALVNDVAPVSALVADDGRHIVTFDNWHSVGFGQDVVVIYDAQGGLVRSMALSDIIPDYFVHGFAQSVSSMYWQHTATRLDGEVLHLAILEPGGDLSDDQRPFYTISIDLAAGAPQPLTEAQMLRLRPMACDRHRARVAEHNQAIDRHRADLLAPTGGDKMEWQRYFSQAVRRLVPPGDDMSDLDAMFGSEPVLLLQPGEYMYRDFRDMFRATLEDASGANSQGFFAALSQDQLVEEVERAARRIRAGSLAGRSLHFFADDTHWPRIASAMSATGATLHQIDTQQAIPQRAEALAELGPEMSVDADCLESTL